MKMISIEQIKEKALNEEKEQLIRTLSHDIRTPLTSILSYSEFLSSPQTCSSEALQEYLPLIQKKALQIRELTDILLDGGKRNPERFEDARLLMEQLIGEFEDALEDNYKVSTDFAQCSPFAGIFDVQVQALSGAPIKRLVFSSRFNYSSSDSILSELLSSDFDFLMLIPAIAPPTISDNIPAATTTLCTTNPVVKSD